MPPCTDAGWAPRGSQNWTHDVKYTAANIIRKAKYAYNRWGCDMFYVDSMEYDAVQPNPGFKHTLIMPSEIWRLVHAELPHILFIPVSACVRVTLSTTLAFISS